MTIDIETIKARAEKAFPLVVHIEDAAAARSCGRLLDYKRANQLVEWCQQDGQRIVDLVKCDIPALLTAIDERDATIRELRNILFPPLVKREDGFGFNDNSAYYNLMGALEDLKHQKADQVCINTIERVLGQLGQARAALAKGA